MKRASLKTLALLIFFLICGSLSARAPAQRALRELPDWAMDQIREDLAPFASGIKRSDIDCYCREEDGVVVLDSSFLVNQPVIRIEIRNNTVRVANGQVDLVRTRCVVNGLRSLARYAALPDTDLILNIGDGIAPSFQGPVFGFAKPANVRGILWPDFEMIAAYPGNNYDEIFAKEAVWKSKIKLVMWRGFTTGGIHVDGVWQSNQLDTWWMLPRACLVLYSLEHPELVDARFTQVVQAERGVAKQMARRGLLAPFMSVGEQLRYRYLIDVDGNSCTYSRFYWILRSRSVPLKVASSNIQWYYRGLKPGIHYVPVEDDLSDLADQIAWLRAHDDEAKKIGLISCQFAQDFLNQEMVLRYMHETLCQYAELLEPLS